MLEPALNRLRTLFGWCDRRIRSRLGLGDRRRPREEAEAAARRELEDLAWAKWRGARKPIEDDGRPTQES
jgi:hypothetical protein